MWIESYDAISNAVLLRASLFVNFRTLANHPDFPGFVFGIQVLTDTPALRIRISVPHDGD
jgi:hypothetical protein